MRIISLVTFGIVIVITFMGTSNAEIIARPDSSGRGAFVIKQTVELPVTPEEAYDLMTGDISGWWDHHFSENPKALYIEAKPGGHFMEIFDDAGNGVQHATVIYAHRGILLRMDGPLGLSGRAALNIVTWRYEKIESGSRVTAEIHILGEINERFAGVGDQVWNHFLIEQLKPYAEANKSAKK